MWIIYLLNLLMLYIRLKSAHIHSKQLHFLRPQMTCATRDVYKPYKHYKPYTKLPNLVSVISYHYFFDLMNTLHLLKKYITFYFLCVVLVLYGYDVHSYFKSMCVYKLNRCTLIPTSLNWH